MKELWPFKIQRKEISKKKEDQRQRNTQKKTMCKTQGSLWFERKIITEVQSRCSKKEFFFFFFFFF